MQVTKLTLLPSVGDHEVDSVWRKLYLVLAKMLHNPDTKMTVQSNHVEFELNGFIIDMWAHCMIVKVEGGPRQRLPNPEHMEKLLKKYIQQLNEEGVENALDDFLQRF